MAHKVFVTRRIPESGIKMLEARGYQVTVSEKDGVLIKDELVTALKGKNYNAILSLLTDHIDADIFEAAGKECKIVANYAVGFDNIDLKAARERAIFITNTPDVLTETVAEHTVALMLAVAHRISEAERFTRKGKYKGWDPMLLLGNDLSHKTVGIIGGGRIGARVAHHVSRGFDARVVYYDIKQNADFEKEYSAVFKSKVEEVLSEADFVSIHVPLLPETKYLMNDSRFGAMKKNAYLINTSRGPIVEEQALIRALRNNIIRGAALDVFENEPALDPILCELENVIVTPHIASATLETREKMSQIAAENIIEAFSGKIPSRVVQQQA
jgi:glyoxylate reductase